LAASLFGSQEHSNCPRVAARRSKIVAGQQPVAYKLSQSCSQAHENVAAGHN